MVMAPPTKSRASQSLPKNRKPAPFTIERLIPLFEDMKDFTRSTVRASEAVLRQEMQEMKTELRQELRGEIGSLRSELKGEIQALRTELKGEIQALRSELKNEIRLLGDKIDLPQHAVTEHSKHIKNLQATTADHEARIA